MTYERGAGKCPVRAFDRAEAGYAERVGEWLANPHAYFRAFGPEARAFQERNRSRRYRTMTLVAPAEKFVGLRPVCLSLDGAKADVESWETAFATSAARLIAAHPATFAALQAAGELEWMGCPPEGTPVAELLAAGALRPGFADLADVIRRIQWLFLMCGVRPNEVIVQVDPFTDEAWATRRKALARKHAEEQKVLEERRAARQVLV